MFQTVGPDGGRRSRREEARTRAELERLVEVMQHKGDSECRLAPDTTDELCGFEKLPYANFVQKYFRYFAEQPAAAQLRARSAAAGLVRGAAARREPVQVRPDRQHRHPPGNAGRRRGARPPGPRRRGRARRRGTLPEGLPDDFEFNPGGLAVIWAEENSRDSLFEAMRRREVYGTSGPRHVVRFFGGWDLPEDLCSQADFAAHGLRARRADGRGPAGRARRTRPRFAVSALRDPGTPQRPGGAAPAHPDREGLARERRRRASRCTRWRATRRTPRASISRPARRAARAATACAASGAIRTSTRASARSTTRAWSRTRAAAGARYVCNARGVDCSDPASGFPRSSRSAAKPGRAKTIQERSWTSPIWYAPPAEAAGGSR